MLEGEYAQAIKRRLAGFDGAKETGAELGRELQELARRRGELRAVVAQARAEMAAAAEDARRAVADRPALLAALAADRLRLAADVDPASPPWHEQSRRFGKTALT